LLCAFLMTIGVLFCVGDVKGACVLHTASRLLYHHIFNSAFCTPAGESRDCLIQAHSGVVDIVGDSDDCCKMWLWICPCPVSNWRTRRPVAMVRRLARGAGWTGPRRNAPHTRSQTYSSKWPRGNDLNALERLMSQLMNEPTCHQFALGPIGTPQKGSFSSSNASTPSSSTKMQQRVKQQQHGKNKQQSPRLDSTSRLNKTPVRPTAALSRKSSSHSPSATYSSTSGSECEERFAGARFTLPPSPDAVPLPPAAWFAN
jgi:hypothetical protein